MSGSLNRSAENRRRPRSTPLLPAFEDFAEAVRSCFAFLVQRYGFEGPDLRQYGRECSVVFRRLPWVAVRISYEPGGNPWVVLTVRLGAASDDPQELSLDSLIRERSRDGSRTQFALRSLFAPSYAGCCRGMRSFSKNAVAIFSREMLKTSPKPATSAVLRKNVGRALLGVAVPAQSQRRAAQGSRNHPRERRFSRMCSAKISSPWVCGRRRAL